MKSSTARWLLNLHRGAGASWCANLLVVALTDVILIARRLAS